MNAATDGAEQDGALLRLAAGGFRDMTRVAAGHPGHLARHLRRERDRHRRGARRAGDRPHRHARPRGRPGPAGHPRRRCRRPARPGATCRPAPCGPSTWPSCASRCPTATASSPRSRPWRPMRASASTTLRSRTPPKGPRGVLILVVDSADAEHPARGRGGRRLPRPGGAAVVTAPRDPRRRRRHALPGHRPHAGREVDLAPLRAPRRAGRGHVGHPRALRRRRRGRLAGRRRGHGGRAWSAATTATVVVHGGRARLHRPDGPLDCGNSGTSMRLLAGLVAGFDWETELVGDESLSSRPMDRVAEPLGLMGAVVTGRGERCLPPLRVRGGALHGIDWTAKVASAQVKSAILLAGLSAEGTTIVREAVTTRTHTEEMLVEAGRRPDGRAVGRGAHRAGAGLLPQAGGAHRARRPLRLGLLRRGRVRRARQRRRRGRRLRRPGPARLRRRPAAHGRVRHAGARGPRHRRPSGPPAGPLTATEVRASEIPSLDEIPALAVAAAVAAGHDGLHRRGRAAGEGGRPAGGRGRHGRGLRRPAPRIDGDTLAITGRRRAAARRPLRQPGRPPHGHGGRRGRAGRPSGGAQPHHRVRRRRDQLPGLRRRPRRGWPHGAGGPRGRCWSPSTGRPEPASRPSRGRWPSGWASTGSTPAPCTGPSPPWRWSRARRRTTTTRWPRSPAPRPSRWGSG